MKKILIIALIIPVILFCSFYLNEGNETKINDDEHVYLVPIDLKHISPLEYTDVSTHPITCCGESFE
ncbi:MAG: hypothetical protein GY714_09095 [Desulfobacterales bacterium]|nr:hypothetical protein [Desulfobacterales bacterium]